MSLLGVDVGTSSLKAVAYDAGTGRPIGSARTTYAMSLPAPGRAELDADDVWAAFVEASRAIAADPNVGRDPVEALAFSVSGDEVVLLGDDGQALAPVILSGDDRGSEDLVALYEAIGPERLAELTGATPSVAFPLVRLLWTAREQPNVFERTTQVLGWAEFLMTRLGVPPVADLTSASRWLLMDLDRAAWSPEILAVTQVAPALLPPIAPSGSEIGRVAPRLAASTGLPPGAAIVTGGYDQACAAIGAGARSFGDTVVGTGTWEVLTSLVDSSIGAAATERGAATGASTLPGLRCVYALNPGGGSIVEWYRDRLGQDAQPVGVLLDELPEAPAPLLSLPHFQGSGTAWRDPASRGAVLGLSWATTGPELLLGLLEGITFELRANLELFQAAGARIDSVRNTGGGARSARWVQLKADVLGLPVETVDVDEPGCLAAACLAGAGIGRLASADDAIARFVHVARRFEPDAERTAQYAERYALYRRLYTALAPISHDLLLEGPRWHA